MEKNLIVLLMLIVISTSCNKQKNSDDFSIDKSANSETVNTDGLNLLKQNCYACHSVTTKSHDEIIAPPMIAVKKRYLMQYDNKEDFVNAMVAFSLNPNAENALMYGAVNQFNVMPKQNFKEEDLKKIATYIYENEIEKPEWFDAHFQENHKNGQGMGMGNGKGQGMKNK